MSNSNRPIQQELKMFSKYNTCKILSESPHPNETVIRKERNCIFWKFAKKRYLAPSFPVKPPNGNDNQSEKCLPFG